MLYPLEYICSNIPLRWLDKKQQILILLSVTPLENTSSARSEMHEPLGSARHAVGPCNSMNGRHPWLARCRDEARDGVNTTLKRARYRHTTVTEAFMVRGKCTSTRQKFARLQLYSTAPAAGGPSWPRRAEQAGRAQRFG